MGDHRTCARGSPLTSRQTTPTKKDDAAKSSARDKCPCFASVDVVSKNLTTDDIAAALAHFFYRGAGPSHPVITRVLTASGLNDNYQYSPQPGGPTKQTRVLDAFRLAQRQNGARKLVDGLLSALRHDQLIGISDKDQSENEKRLRLALGRSGFMLSEDGQLRAFGGADLQTGGREALEETLTRLRSSGQDPALMIGTAKDLLESVAKFVLEELGTGVPKSASFNELWHIARERLAVLPERVDKNLPGYKEIRAIHQSTWTIAENVNNLRNLQGTGHGHTLPTGVSEDLAFLVVREACSVAEYMLNKLDQEHGRR